jgi:HSP20 family protein
MANIARFDPFSDLTRFEPFSDDFFRGFALSPFLRGSVQGAAPQMRLDVKEDDKAYTVKADIPGVKKEDIKVSVDGNLVSINAEVKQEKEEKEGTKVVRSERYFGSVSRSFTLAQDVDQNGAQAKYNDGVLELTLPKKTGGSKKTISVS